MVESGVKVVPCSVGSGFGVKLLHALAVNNIKHVIHLVNFFISFMIVLKMCKDIYHQARVACATRMLFPPTWMWISWSIFLDLSKSSEGRSIS